MAITSYTKCVCDKCKREQVFETWFEAVASSWRQISIEPLGGVSPAKRIASTSEDHAKAQELRAVVCGDCAGGLGIDAAPPKPLMEM